MRNILCLFLFSVVFFFACKTPEPQISAQAEPLLEPQIIMAVEEEMPPLPSIPIQKTETEYDRAVEKIQMGVITQADFEADKKAVMDNIDLLDEAMRSQDYQKWLSFLSPDSIKYWSNQRNLAAVSLRLPIRGQVIRSVIDYFTMIFIPSRSAAHINEIRYVSKSVIKAVESSEGQDIIYYTFIKVGNKWLLKLDTLE